MTVTDNRPSLANPGPGLTTDTDTAATTMPDANRVALPDGAWVVLKDAKLIRQKDRKKVMAAMDEANATTGVMIAATSVQDRIASLVVADWSYRHTTEPTCPRNADGAAEPLELPSVRLDALDELEIAPYDAISKLCEPYMDELFPDFSPAGSDNEERTGPTGPSDD